MDAFVREANAFADQRRIALGRAGSGRIALGRAGRCDDFGQSWDDALVSMAWPSTAEDLAREQERLARSREAPWTMASRPGRVGACAVVFGRGGRSDVAWAAAAVDEAGEARATSVAVARVGAEFLPGLLALREGPILEAVVRGLSIRPDVLIVAAAGRDHPRRAGLALQLGAVLDLPTVGVTEDSLVAIGREPAHAQGSRCPLRIGDEVVAYRLRTRSGTKPVIAHAGWRTSAETAADVVLGACARARWPEPMRVARRIARDLRAHRVGPSG